jgi:hypothetical protein
LGSLPVEYLQRQASSGLAVFKRMTCRAIFFYAGAAEMWGTGSGRE